MQQSRGNLMRGVGERLKKLRKELNLSSRQMAARLGITNVSYYKNESDSSMPGMISLHRLHEDFDVSMDWLLFDHGAMFLEEQKPEAEEEKKAQDQEQPGSEIKQLLAYMDQDPLLRHEILVYFYKYKNNKETEE